MSKHRIRKPLGQTIWFKAALTLALFIPPLSKISYDSAVTSDVIASVLGHPWIISVPVLLPLAKLVLLSAVILPFLLNSISGRVVMIYYGVMLIPVGIFQNIAITENYGFVWLIGNTVVQCCVAAYCLYTAFHHLTGIRREKIDKRRLWIIIPMLIAFLMPYIADGQGIIRPAFPMSVLWNESGVTYCMITPVVIGMLLLFPQNAYKPALSVISYIGLLFGLLNMMTWFALNSESWWMGVLHLPLLILSIYGMLSAHQANRKDMEAAK